MLFCFCTCLSRRAHLFDHMKTLCIVVKNCFLSVLLIEIFIYPYDINWLKSSTSLSFTIGKMAFIHRKVSFSIDWFKKKKKKTKKNLWTKCHMSYELECKRYLRLHCLLWGNLLENNNKSNGPLEWIHLLLKKYITLSSFICFWFFFYNRFIKKKKHI